jgi:serine/threonine-protein kinase
LTSSDSISHGRFPPGTVLDARYRVIGLLGKGGMGEVYRADDLRLGQPVALKFLPDSVGHDPGKLAQFHNEVRTARQVSHPNICRVHDIGDVDGQLFISMEFVDGEDLATSLRRIGRFPEDKATDIARQLCAGLAAAHDRGILHRDLKPANIMLDGAGKVRLMDFGLAAIGVVDDVRAGTPAYMAPEQFLGQEVTARTDIYALGLVLYELYTGRRAFTAPTLSELIDQQQIGQVTPPASIVTGLDRSIERVILRCLDPVPARRPVSALAVSAALPGGDPLAAALAAGETPSPEMVAAAGEGAGLGRRAALSILAAIVLGVAGSYAMALRTSPLAMIRPELTAEVLAQKAREAIRQIGYPGRASDEAYGFEWDGLLIDHFKGQAAPPVAWNEALSRRPAPLLFWYRRSESPMTAVQFHTDLLTPGIVAPDDPAPIESGMLALKLDHQGYLTYLEAIPPQLDENADPRPAVDWAPLLALAGLDPATLTIANPQWNWLAGADTRAAWTGMWPGTSLPLRVEAAALRGRPVAFMTMGPWTRPWRTSSASSGKEMALIAVLFLLAFAILAGGSLLARKNLREGRGDRGGAAVLGCSLAGVLLLLWACRVHVVASMGLPAMFLIAVCTAVFYGVLFWALYLAIEPFLRRHWPQTLVSWTTLLGGRVRDRVVGRDVLVGVALGVAIAVLVRGSELLAGEIIWPSVDLLLGTRSTIGEILTRTIYAARTAIFIVFVLVMLRVLFRSQWMAAIVFVVMLTAVNVLDSDKTVSDGVLSLLYFSMFAATILKWGFTSLTVGLITGDLLIILPAGTELSAWYAGQTALLIAFPLALAAWAVYTSVGVRRPAAGR